MSTNINIKSKIDHLVLKDGSKIKAFASATIANSFAIHGIKVIESSKGLFVQMPQSSFTPKDGEKQYNDICHPITPEARVELIHSVLDAYEERLHMEEEQSQETENDMSQTM